MQQDDNTMPWAVSMALGIIIIIIAFAAASVEIVNNWKFGSSITLGAGMAAVVFGICVPLLPILMADNKDFRQLAAVHRFCVATTILCSVLAYTTSLGEKLDNAQTAQDVYKRSIAEIGEAKREAADARKRADAIAITESVSSLEAAISQTKAKISGLVGKARRYGVGRRTDSDETVCQSYRPCRAAQDILAKQIGALGKAQAKAAFLHRAAAAEAKVNAARKEAKSGPGHIKGLAKIVAAGVAAAGWEISLAAASMWVDGALTLLFVTAMVRISTISPHGFRKIRDGMDKRRRNREERLREQQEDTERKERQAEDEKAKAETAQIRQQVARKIVSAKSAEETAFDKMLKFVHKGETDGHAKSVRSLAKVAGIPENSLKRYLDRWESVGFIRIKKFEGNAIQIEILNQWAAARSEKPSRKRGQTA